MKFFFWRRFDLIFLLLDPQNDIYDRKLATHLVSLYYAREDVDENMMVRCAKYVRLASRSPFLIEFFCAGNGSIERLHYVREGEY